MKEQTDKKFMEWLYQRLINVYREDPDTDFVQRFKEIVDKFDDGGEYSREFVPLSKEFSCTDPLVNKIYIKSDGGKYLYRDSSDGGYFYNKLLKDKIDKKIHDDLKQLIKYYEKIYN